MKSKLCFVLLAISTLSGCYIKARLYPVQGSLSAQTPVPVLMAKITGKINLDTISVILEDGEVCKGRWILVNHVQSPKGANSVIAPATSMSGVWDSIYGPGFYLSRIVGARNYAQAVASGNRGTVLDVEMSSGTASDGSPIIGVARDNKDNVYKLVFGG